MYIPVPGISGRGATNKRDFQGTNPVRPPGPGAGTFWCRTGARSGPSGTPGPTRSATAAGTLACMTHQK